MKTIRQTTTKEASGVAVCEADGRVVACDAAFAEALGEWHGANATTLQGASTHPTGAALWTQFAAFAAHDRAAGWSEARFTLRSHGREQAVRLRRLEAQGAPRVLVEFGAAAPEKSAERESEMRILRLLHDFKNQLGGMKLYAAYLKKRFAADADGVEVCEKLIRGLNVMAERAKLVSRLARPMMLSAAEVDLLRVLRQAVADVEAEAERRGVRLRVNLPESPMPLTLDAAQTRQALASVLRRAVHVTPTGREVSVALQDRPSEASIEINDAGARVPAHEREALFDFFAGGGLLESVEPREEREELALRLALAQRVIEQHGGQVAVADAPGSGTAVQIRLPRS